MRVGVAIWNDPWRFFEDIFQDLSARHKIDVFTQRHIRTPFLKQRINRSLFSHDLNAFLKRNDVVFFEWASELLVAATRLPKQCGIVTRLHRYELFRWADEVNWEVVDRIILVSEAIQRQFATKFPSQAHKTEVIPEAVSTEKYTPSGRLFAGDIGTLCYLTPRKRVYELILAYYKIVQSNDRLRLHICGPSQDGFRDYYEALHALVRRLQLHDKVAFYGEVADAWNWYRNVDIFVSNSYSEGLQVAPMEAMASGCYTLSHHWDGAEELLPEANLYFTDDELVEKILRYCDASDEERRLHQEAMRAIACERFDVRRICGQVRQIVEDVAQVHI